MNRTDAQRAARTGRRLLLTALAAAVIGACLASPATARTVYDYEYSGTYVDGSTTGRTFDGQIAGVHYDPVDDVLLVVNGNNSGAGWIAKVRPNGTPVDFPATGQPIRTMVGFGVGIANGQVTVERIGGPHDGNVYAAQGNAHGFTAAGSPIPGFNFSQENLCGVAVDGSDEFSDIIISGRNGMYRYERDGTQTREDFSGSPGWEPGTKRKWSERGKACKPVIDGEHSLYGIKAGVISFQDLRNLIVKMDLFGLEKYEVNQFEDSVGVAIDHSNDDVVILRDSNPDGFELYDSRGRFLGSGYGGAQNGYEGLDVSQGAGITVDPDTHDVWIANRREYPGGARRVERFVRTNPHVIPDVTAIEPGYPSPNGETMELRGTINPDGVATSDCYFEYGNTQKLGTKVDCAQGDEFTGTSPQQVTAQISVPKGQRYWYKLFAENPEGVVSSNSQAFFPQGLPKLEFLAADRINTDGARFRTEFDPNGGNVSYHFEYGPPGELNQSTPESDTFGFKTENENFSGQDLYQPGVKESRVTVNDLVPGQEYDLRVVLTNEAGSVASQPIRFRTYVPDPGTDPCPNAHERQQTEASLLADCRAYELVSAADTGGFDVVSDIVPEQTPLTAYPRASDRLLYSTHSGVIPGIAGSPTNKGLDPYVAVRGENGWTTRYVGLPADGMEATSSFGSPLLGADDGLRTFAFGGPGICAPCWADGTTNVPLRVADSPSLVKGMVGSPSPPADPEGEVRAPLSADGSHFVFGSSKRFAPGGNEGSLSIYSRDLEAGETRLVSTMPNGQAMGGQPAQLDVSADGGRTLIGQPVGTDAGGNTTYDLYMHLGTGPESVVVADTPNGVVFNGMTSDGTKVLFTTTDALAGDTDSSADLYRAEVGPGGATITRVSSGVGSGNSDACAPTGNWNRASGGPDCSVVTFAGGAGVAEDSGVAYFLSPETLAGPGGGVEGEPNLFAAAPGGSPEFVATIEVGNEAIEHGLEEAAIHRYGDFQTTPNGEFAVFETGEPLEPDYLNLGFTEIYRYRLSDGALDCVSCAPTGAVPGSDTTLTEHGLNLTDDGRVFFTTLEALALRDTNEKRDAYQWSEGEVQLVSAGIGQHDSSLVTVSADGTNAFFFTRDTLSPTDKNGETVKIYVARAGGGFAHDPSLLPCAAADECRGPGSQQPPAPVISTVTGSGRPSAVLAAPKPKKPKRCKRGQVRRRGKCVKRKNAKRKGRKGAAKRRRGGRR